MDRVLEVILVLIMIGATLAFGGVQPIAYSLMEVAVFLATPALLLNQTRKGRLGLILPIWPMLFALLAMLQLIPLPSRLVTLLSPSHQSIPGLAGLSDGKEAWTALSISSHDTVLDLMKFLAYVGAFLLAAYLFDSRKRRSIVVHGLILLGCFEAIYGIVQYLTGWQQIFIYKKTFDLEEATGTYINRNHFAGVLELTLPFVLAAGFYSFQIWSEYRQSGPNPRADAERSMAGFRAIFYLFLTAIVIVAIIFSRSRSGILASAFSIVFIVLLGQVKTKRKIWTVGFLLLLATIVGYGLWIGLDPVLSRFENVRESGYLQLEGRVAIWKDAMRVVRDHPLVGTGLGTFGVAFRQYQTGLVNSFTDHAHNDYLEFASDTGLLGAALLFLPILYLFVKMISRFLDDPRRYRRSVTLACIGSTLALIIHSISDFNLQIPANALIFAVILGIGYKITCVERNGDSRKTG